MAPPSLMRGSPSTGSSAKGRWLPQLAIAACLLYGLAFIIRNALEVNGHRYFTLLDDALVSMRYARNLARGHGLVWNPGGARVEGFTDPLWVAAMAILHLIPAPSRVVPLFVQLLSLGLLASTSVAVARLVLLLEPGENALAGAAVLLSGLYLPLVTWSLLGMEVGALSCLVCWATLLALSAMREDRFPLSAHLLFAIGTWIRMDVAIIWAAFTLCLAVLQPRHRTRHFAVATGLVVLSFAIQSLARRVYFGEWLPNTYYLKMTGAPLEVRVVQGLRTFWRFAFGFGVPWLLIAASSVAIRRLRHSAALFLSMAGAQFLYDIWVGGDFIESWRGANRFIAPVMPLVFILVVLCLGTLQRAWSRRRPVPSWAQGLAVALGIALCLWDTNDFHRVSLSQWSLAAPALSVSEDRQELEKAEWVQRITESDAKVAVVWAGTVPYYTDRPSIDLLGKADRTIAHQDPVHPGPADTPFWPGHQKWNFAYSIGQMQPDVITELWGLPHPVRYLSLKAAPADAIPFLVGRFLRVQFGDEAVLLRKGSPRIRWDVVRQLATRVSLAD